MQFFKYILIVFSSLTIVSKTLPVGKAGVDSIYQHMGQVDRLCQLVWVHQENTHYLPHTIYDFGGVYFDHPLSEPPGIDGVAIAVQLDERMNPLPGIMLRLPDLQTLAAISQSDLLSTYFYFLKSNCKAYGIDCLILPDVPPDHSGLLNALNRMEAFDPSFFKRKNSLSFDQVMKKRDMIEIFQQNDYWVVEMDFINQVNKGFQKHLSHIPVNRLEHKIKNALNTYRHDRNYKARILPEKLDVALNKASVIPLQRKPGILPLSSDTLCLISNDSYSLLGNMLRKYVPVITSTAEIQKSQAPILVDDRSVPENLITGDRQVIYIGSLESFKSRTTQVDAALLFVQYNDIYDYALPQQLFGAESSTGILPVQSPEYALFDNSPVKSLDILGYAPPEKSGLDHDAQEKIKEILTEAIQSGSTPGCQLAVAVNGSIILNEGYGYLTYDSVLAVDRQTMYDLASVTKVTATLLSVMKLYDEGSLDLDAPIASYLAAYDKSNKRDVTVRQILAHHSGLKSYVPFWKKVLSSDHLDPFYYETEEDEILDKRSYGIRPNPILIDSLENWILNSPMVNGDDDAFYNYSDIGFMILHQLIERLTGMPMDQYLENELYRKMALTHTTFNPRAKKFMPFEIAPTEYDYYFRNELVWGEVHDRNAAVFGGVSGHAGLFSNAQELLVILQTILQGGKYGGTRYFREETIQYFNQQYYSDNRRALGWDKKDNLNKNASVYASDRSFGHTGFTGTMVWVDPSYDLTFVFLANRIYPNANNYQLNKRNIRTRLQDVVYEAILSKWLN